MCRISYFNSVKACIDDMNSDQKVAKVTFYQHNCFVCQLLLID
jgi:hypothetical protein